MAFRKLIAVAAVAIFSGCATNYAVAPPGEVSRAIEIKDSSFDANITYTGPQVGSETRRGIFVDYETVQLVAMKSKKTGVVAYMVYASVLYSFDWRFYGSASFQDGKQVDVRVMDRQVNSCSPSIGCIHTESVVFLVDLDRLKSGGDLVFRLNSKGAAENIIKIPRSYIDGFLGGVPVTR
ncbi:hypothetical protein [Sphaerotilus hippei]|uniref:hypothetical protein n=1 Tax=Sphaerotilus hippei TaxID=744406 RepID=UPI0014765F88|nr:hypothetical protein [Sphaerotilus hippei]